MVAAQHDPGASARQPRDFLRTPNSFGKRPDAEWVVEPDTPRDLLAAAWLQHQASLVVQYEVMSRRGGVAALARELGKNADFLRRKLRGERWANIRDLGAWMVAVGHEVLPRLRTDHDVLPPPEFTATEPNPP